MTGPRQLSDDTGLPRSTVSTGATTLSSAVVTGSTTPSSSRRRFVPLVGAFICAVLVAGSAGLADSQTNAEIDRIREERRAAEAEATAKAQEVDVADAELEEVSAALAAINSAVNSQQGRVDNAERQLADAEVTVANAEQAVADGEALIIELEDQLAASAISGFVNQNDTSTLLVESDDPNLGLRMQVLVDEITQSGIDLVDSLRRAKEDLEVERGIAEAAAIEAEEKSAELADELALLEENQGVQADLAAEAEDRFNALLAEQASLEALGVELAEEERAAQAELAAELARQAPAAPPTSGGSAAPAAPVTSSNEIVNAGNGIWVHASIADDVRRLLADAAAAGVPLAGGGYRDPAGQIRVRQNNCGTSDYAVYQMPASQCRPPTARPGTSMHERGLAIDFTYNGRIIGSRSGPAWNWLSANAANYGLYNLPSEPWHWSTSGG